MSNRYKTMQKLTLTNIPVFLFLLLLTLHQQSTQAQQIIPTDEFYNGIQNSLYNAIIDVRTQNEWDSGHIPNATHIENLQNMRLPPFPSLLDPCNSKNNTIVVYCRSGSRAASAITMLKRAGFQGTLLNGQGVSQWTTSGYDLVFTESQDPKCFLEEEKGGGRKVVRTRSPKSPPTKSPTMTPTLPSTLRPTKKPTESPTIISTNFDPTLIPTSDPTSSLTNSDGVDLLVNAPTLAIYYDYDPPTTESTKNDATNEEEEEVEEEPCAWFPFVHLC